MKRARWPILLYQLFWLIFFVPAHTRGQITVPSGRGGDACCEVVVKKPVRACCDADAPKPAKHGEPTEDQKRRCAVCYVTQGYTLAPVFDFRLEIAGRVIERLRSIDAQVEAIEFAFPFFPNGPPATA